MAKSAAQEIIDSQQWLDKVGEPLQGAITALFKSGGEPGKVVKDLLNGVWLGHSLHPVLTDVPIGAWTMTQMFDLMSIARGDDPALDAASDVTLGAGIVASVPVIITGFTDWSDIHGERDERMGLAHGLVNSAGLLLNLISLGLRVAGNGNRRLARSLSAGGYLLNGLAAYLGGELVYTQGVAINRSAWVSGPKKYTDVAAVEDLESGKMVKVEVDGRPVVLLQHDDGIHAFEGTCPHRGCGLWEGKLDGHTVTCPCHGSEFDVTDGSLIHGPATVSIPTYEVRKRTGRVQLRMRS